MQARLTRQLKEARAEWRAAKEESKALQARLDTSHKQVPHASFTACHKTQKYVLLSVYVLEYGLSTCAVCAAGQDCKVCVQYADSPPIWISRGTCREPLLTLLGN